MKIFFTPWSFPTFMGFPWDLYGFHPWDLHGNSKHPGIPLESKKNLTNFSHALLRQVVETRSVSLTLQRTFPVDWIQSRKSPQTSWISAWQRGESSESHFRVFSTTSITIPWLKSANFTLSSINSVCTTVTMGEAYRSVHQNHSIHLFSTINSALFEPLGTEKKKSWEHTSWSA